MYHFYIVIFAYETAGEKQTKMRRLVCLRPGKFYRGGYFLPSNPGLKRKGRKNRPERQAGL